MRKITSRWHRRKRGYYYLITSVGLFGLFLILAGISSGDRTWIFTVLGFVSLVLCMRKGLELWGLDRLVFNRRAFGPAPWRQPAADIRRPEPREQVLRGSALDSRPLRFAESGPSRRTS